MCIRARAHYSTYPFPYVCDSACVCLSVCPCGLSCRRKRSLWLKIIAVRRYYGNQLRRPVSLPQQLEMYAYDVSAGTKHFIGHHNLTYAVQRRWTVYGQQTMNDMLESRIRLPSCTVVSLHLFSPNRLLLGRLLRVDLITFVGLKCPSARPYVRLSTKRFSNFNEIWYVGRGR